MLKNKINKIIADWVNPRSIGTMVFVAAFCAFSPFLLIHITDLYWYLMPPELDEYGGKIAIVILLTTLVLFILWAAEIFPSLRAIGLKIKPNKD